MRSLFANWFGRLQKSFPALTTETSAAPVQIRINGQKWLGPGETLRVIEIERFGETQQIALWAGRQGAQMILLDSAKQADIARRQAS